MEDKHKTARILSEILNLPDSYTSRVCPVNQRSFTQFHPSENIFFNAGASTVDQSVVNLVNKWPNVNSLVKIICSMRLHSQV